MDSSEETGRPNSAFARQVGGSHYKDWPIQPTKFLSANEEHLGWRESNIIKYICRWKEKGGRQDLAKAMHYLEMLHEEAPEHRWPIPGTFTKDPTPPAQPESPEPPDPHPSEAEDPEEILFERPPTTTLGQLVDYYLSHARRQSNRRSR